jgi:hypothetical protein
MPGAFVEMYVHPFNWHTDFTLIDAQVCASAVVMEFAHANTKKIFIASTPHRDEGEVLGRSGCMLTGSKLNAGTN